MRIAIGGGGDIWWLFYVIELVRTFWTVWRWEIKNFNFRLLARSHFHHSNTLVYLTRLLRPPKCIWGADCNWRWWGHLMTILCNRTRSNFLNCKTMGNQKLKFSLAHSLALVFTIQIHWCILLACWDLPNVYGVLIAIGGGGDIWWLFYVIELVRTFWTVRRWKIKNLNFRSLTRSLAHSPSLARSLARSLTERATWWNFHYLIFYYCNTFTSGCFWIKYFISQFTSLLSQFVTNQTLTVVSRQVLPSLTRTKRCFASIPSAAATELKNAIPRCRNKHAASSQTTSIALNSHMRTERANLGRNARPSCSSSANFERKLGTQTHWISDQGWKNAIIAVNAMSAWKWHKL